MEPSSAQRLHDPVTFPFTERHREGESRRCSTSNTHCSQLHQHRHAHHTLVILSVSYKFTCLTLPTKYCVIICWYAFIDKCCLFVFASFHRSDVEMQEWRHAFQFNSIQFCSLQFGSVRSKDVIHAFGGKSLHPTLSL